MSSSPLALDHTKSGDVNLGVLQAKDPGVTALLSTATHVTLYDFNDASKKWDRKGFEGALFVVERSCAPRHRLVLLNRLSPENFVIDIVPTLKCQVEPPFFIVRIPPRETVGVWFYNDVERLATIELVQSLIGSGPKPAAARATAPAKGKGGRLVPAQVATKGKGGRLVPAQVATKAGKHGKRGQAPAPAPAPAPVPAPAPPLPPSPAPAGTPLSLARLFASAAAAQGTPEPAGGGGPPLSFGLLKATLMELASDDQFVGIVHSKMLEVASRRVG